MIKVKEEAETKEEELKKLKYITRRAIVSSKKYKENIKFLIQMPRSLLEEIDKDVIYDIEGTRTSWMRDAFVEKIKRSKRNQKDKL